MLKEMIKRETERLVAEAGETMRGELAHVLELYRFTEIETETGEKMAQWIFKGNDGMGLRIREWLDGGDGGTDRLVICPVIFCEEHWEWDPPGYKDFDGTLDQAKSGLLAWLASEEAFVCPECGGNAACEECTGETITGKEYLEILAVAR